MGLAELIKKLATGIMRKDTDAYKTSNVETTVTRVDNSKLNHLRNLVTFLTVTSATGTLTSKYIGAYDWPEKTKTIGIDEAVSAVAILLSGEPEKTGGDWNTSTEYSNVRFKHSSDGTSHRIKIVFDYKSWGPRLWGVIKTHYKHYEITLEGKLLEDDLTDISKMIPELKEPVEQGIRDYVKICFELGILPHISKVHSFPDAVQQAYTIAVTGRNFEEQRKLAMMTFLSHLFDDYVDPISDISKRLRGFNGSYDAAKQKLDYIVQRLMDRMIDLAAPDKKEGVQSTVLKIIYGALIQQSKTYFEQKANSRDYQSFVMHKIKNPNLRTDVEKLHPMQVALTCHTAVDMLFALETDNTETDLAELYSLFYAPMLYCHDRAEEASSEGERFMMSYGRELCENEYISDGNLIGLIDIFDRHVNSYNDPRRDLRIKQVKMLYKAFEPVLSETLRERYRLSIARLSSG